MVSEEGSRSKGISKGGAAKVVGYSALVGYFIPHVAVELAKQGTAFLQGRNYYQGASATEIAIDAGLKIGTIVATADTYYRIKNWFKNRGR